MTSEIEKKMIAGYYKQGDEIVELEAKVRFYESIICDTIAALRNNEFMTWDELGDDIKQVWREVEE